MQAITLLGVALGTALSLFLGAEPGTAMSIVVACLVCVWIVADGIAAVLHAAAERQMRAETRSAFLQRIATKLVGLCALVGIVVVACAVFPFFARSPAVQWFVGAGYATVVPLAILMVLTAVYVAVTDWLADTPDDYLHQVGRAVLMQNFREADVLFAFRVVTIKCFFLVLMFSAGMAGLQALSENPVWRQPLLSAAWFDSMIRLLYLVDVALAAGGYIATFKLFGWHIRATETTVLGWLVCLICYEPFFPAISGAFVPYGDGVGPGRIVQEGSGLFVLWSLATLFFHAVYVWATVAFGPRFSNLTHRGIITTGPYRFTKHPAYLAKNAAWWLASVPAFVASGLADGLARAGMLAIISLIYLLRARAEERMLSVDPVYRAYAADVAQRGLVGTARRLLAPPAA